VSKTGIWRCSVCGEDISDIEVERERRKSKWQN
jgi:ribosomal protein L37AE/L43A